MTNIDSIGGPSAALKKANHFIEFQIKDAEKGNPVSGATVFVRFGNGEIYSQMSGSTGRVHIRYIPEGPCDLMECVKGHVLLEEKSRYTLEDGDHLQALVDREGQNGNDISPEELAAANWGDGARDLNVANQHMRDRFGCTRYGFRNMMVYSKKKNASHSLVIPGRVERKGLSIDQVHEIRVIIKATEPQTLGCGCVPRVSFSRTRSFIRPYATEHFTRFKSVLEENSDGRIMIFGHSDVMKQDAKAKAVSFRRAKSTLALLTRNTDVWLELFKDGKNPDNEDWGVRVVQVMLNHLNPDAKLDLSNHLDDRTVRELETQTGQSCKKTFFGKKLTDSQLKTLFKIYMDKVAGGLVLDESRFVPLKHAGCSCFNILARPEHGEEDNGRVTMYVFNPGRLPAFPCSGSDMTPCRDQSDQYDHSTTLPYRNNPSFRCAFYDSLARECPCETIFPDIIALDSHMHFMTAHTTPMPLLWNQLPFLRPSRTGLESFGKGLMGTGLSRGAKMGANKTQDIADTCIKQNISIFNSLYARELKKGKDRKMLTPMIPMPMDMEFAHLDGYKGKPIYNKVSEREFYIKKIIDYTPEGMENTRNVRITLWPDEVANEIPGLTKTRSRIKASEGLQETDIIKEKRGSKKQVNEGFYYYYDRKNENMDISTVKDKSPYWMHWEEADLFIDWDDQVKDTVTAAVSYPFQYIPMYHYDPRRWMVTEEGSQGFEDPKTKVVRKYPQGWDIPFKHIATHKQAGVFIGFKMYTALGYRPDDYKIWGDFSGKAWLPALSSFYQRCQDENIPILCHCSPSGMCTHDIKLYYNLAKPAYMQGNAKTWFYDQFVSPAAWEPVLLKFKKLKLCLAHFGGGSSDWADWKNNTNSKLWERYDPPENTVKEPVTKADLERFIAEGYDKKDRKTGKHSWIRQLTDLMEKKNDDGSYTLPNLHTDISYHFIKNHSKELLWLIIHHPVVKERILFGTDWYMTELDKKSFENMVGESKQALDAMSQEYAKKTGDYEDLWLMFSRINPMKFYGIRSVADKFAEGLRSHLTSDDKDDVEPIIKNALKIIKNSDGY